MVRPAYRVISLGLGTQSSALYAMAARGEIEADIAVFADTQNEPADVYEYRDELTAKFGSEIPLITITRGNLAQDIMDAIDRDKSFRFPPMFMSADTFDGDRKIVLLTQRQCTVDYKIQLVKKAARKHFGGHPGGRPDYDLEMLLGITTDEASRMKPSPIGYIRHVYPLIDMDMHREDTTRYLTEAGLPPPPKSACYQCAFKSDALWMGLKHNDPEAFEKACVFDDKLRSRADHKVLSQLEGQVWLHSSARPLREVNFDKPALVQGSFEFGCDSYHCGV